MLILQTEKFHVKEDKKVSESKQAENWRSGMTNCNNQYKQWAKWLVGWLVG